MAIQVGILIVSIVALYYGAEFALEAAEKIGKFFKLSPLVIGLLLIGFGTSLPEFFVSQLACLKGEPGIALGNIVGSNIANLFLILGVSGLLTKLTLHKKEIQFQLFLHIGITTLLTVTLLFLGVGMASSILLITFFFAYLWLTFSSMKEGDKDEDDEDSFIGIGTFLRLLSGFCLLYIGGEWLVSSGSQIGLALGVSSYVISAIFVAFGTSFPELVTACIAASKGKDRDLIVGNIIGSNIFNVAFVLGSLGLYEIRVEKSFFIELVALWMAAIFLVVLGICKMNFSRLSSVLFLSVYTALIFHWIT